MKRWEILQGDCREAMKALPDVSVDAIVTDPPYELGFMGKGWDKTGVANDVRTWAECLRVLKPGGYLLAFSGARTYHRMVCAVEDAGFEIRDQLAWVYGSGFPKSHNGPWGGTALKPAWEPIVMARKPLIGTVEENWMVHGTGGLAVDGCRIGGESTLRVKQGGANQFPHEDDGWVPKTVEVGSDAGRWPANLAHDGSDEVLAAFPQAPGQQGVARTDGADQGNNTYGALKHVTKRPEPRGDTGSAARFFYCAKASKRDRDEGLDALPDKLFGMSNAAAAARGEMYDNGDGGVNRVTVRKNHHPTVKPTDLMRWLLRLVTPAGGAVLDPFLGSGSTGKAAMLEGLQFIGCELNPDYIKLAEARIAAAEAEVLW